jgi:hypothetical protein
MARANISDEELDKVVQELVKPFGRSLVSLAREMGHRPDVLSYALRTRRGLLQIKAEQARQRENILTIAEDPAAIRSLLDSKGFGHLEPTVISLCAALGLTHKYWAIEQSLRRRRKAIH